MEKSFDYDTIYASWRQQIRLRVPPEAEELLNKALRAGREAARAIAAAEAAARKVEPATAAAQETALEVLDKLRAMQKELDEDLETKRKEAAEALEAANRARATFNEDVRASGALLEAVSELAKADAYVEKATTRSEQVAKRIAQVEDLAGGFVEESGVEGWMG